MHMCRRLPRFERLRGATRILDISKSLKFRATIRLRGWLATTLADYDKSACTVNFEGNGKDRPSRGGRSVDSPQATKGTWGCEGITRFGRFRS